SSADEQQGEASMTFTRYLAGTALAATLTAGALSAHPLDGITAEEYQKINEILRTAGTVDDETLYPLIELREPPKAEVYAFQSGGATPDRKATVHYTGADSFREAVVNITQGTVESDAPTPGQPMVLFTEFMGAMTGALGHPDMVAGLEKRGLTPEQAFCLPLTAGNFFTEEYQGTRLMRVPCYQ